MSNLMRYMPWVAAIVIGSCLTWLSIVELRHSVWLSVAFGMGIPLLLAGAGYWKHRLSNEGPKGGCCCGVIPLILFLFVWPILRDLPSDGRRVSCLGNINQVNLAISMYSHDWDGKLPEAARWMDRVQPVSYPSVFRCPEVPEGQGYGYAMNNAKARLPEKHSELYPLVFETGDLARNAFGQYPQKLANPARHPNGSNWVGYADGHAKLVRVNSLR